MTTGTGRRFEMLVLVACDPLASIAATNFTVVIRPLALPSFIILAASIYLPNATGR